MHRLRHLALGLLALAFAACGGHLGDLVTVPVLHGPIEPPPAATLLFRRSATGLVALAAGNGVVRVDWVLPGSGFEAALFLASAPDTVFQAAPVVEVLTGTSALITTAAQPALVANGSYVFAGFGIRATGTTAWTPVGTVLRARPSVRTLHVDPAGSPTGDGQSPATAMSLLDNALLVAAVFASAFGDVNVHVLEGTYTTRAFDAATQEGGAFTIGPGVHVYGGFTAGFAMSAREPTAGRTILQGGPTRTIVDFVSGGELHVLDGCRIDGRDTSTEGIDITESDGELRSVTAVRCVDNGVRIRQQLDFTNRRRVLLVACDVSRNGNDGLGLAGVFDATFDRSTFDANGASGIDVNDLLALNNASASVTAFGCRFFGNANEGLGIDLNVITTANQQPGGRYDITAVSCNFERNGTIGLRVDEDHDLFPFWSTRVRVRDCSARANRQAGIHFDADDRGDYVLDRVRCTANGGDGLLVTSEPEDQTTADDDQAAGHVNVLNSWFGGNLGVGLRTAQGEKVALASHCVFSGNQGGGMVSEQTHLGVTNTRRIGSAVSCVLWRQPSPFTNVFAEACWIEGQDNPFHNAPALFAVASAHQNGVLSLTANPGITQGQAVVVGDDRTARNVTASNAGSVVVDPAPAVFVAPDAVFGYATSAIADDLHIAVGHPAQGTGRVPAGAPAVDPGPHGHAGGGEPGRFDPFTAATLRLLQTAPPIATGVTPTTPIALTFDRPLDPASVTPDRVRVLGVSGIGLNVSGNTLTVSPPAAGWSGANVLELNIGIIGQDGTPFGAPLLVPVLTR